MRLLPENRSPASCVNDSDSVRRVLHLERNCLAVVAVDVEGVAVSIDELRTVPGLHHQHELPGPSEPVARVKGSTATRRQLVADPAVGELEGLRAAIERDRQYVFRRVEDLDGRVRRAEAARPGEVAADPDAHQPTAGGHDYQKRHQRQNSENRQDIAQAEVAVATRFLVPLDCQHSRLLQKRGCSVVKLLRKYSTFNLICQ